MHLAPRWLHGEPSGKPIRSFGVLFGRVRVDKSSQRLIFERNPRLILKCSFFYFSRFGSMPGSSWRRVWEPKQRPREASENTIRSLGDLLTAKRHLRTSHGLPKA